MNFVGEKKCLRKKNICLLISGGEFHSSWPLSNKPARPRKKGAISVAAKLRKVGFRLPNSANPGCSRRIEEKAGQSDPQKRVRRGQRMLQPGGSAQQVVEATVCVFVGGGGGGGRVCSEFVCLSVFSCARICSFYLSACLPADSSASA